MIEIIQQKIDLGTLYNQISKMNEFSVKLNKELIAKDHERLQAMLASTKNRYDIANIKAILEYLEKLMKYTDDEANFEMCWNVKNDLAHSYPLDIINERVYGIDSCNYIEISGKEKLIEMNMTDLADMIAFEMMYKDLGETHNSIEELLKNCGIIGIEKASLLTDMFKANGDKVFELSKSMKIDETPYYSHETKKVHDYFSSRDFRKDGYRDIVDYSCRIANTIILNTIYKNATRYNINFKLLVLNATDIAFMIETEDENTIKQNLLTDISVRIFGRRFKVEPLVQIF
jgi:hypothetical protein